MPDPRKTPAPRARPGDSTESGAPGEQLAELNDHLGRFLGHADQLLDEWARFGAQVRATVDEQASRLDASMSSAVERAAERAGRTMADRLDADVAARVDRTLGEGVTRLRGELDRLASTARAAAGTPVRGGQKDVGRWTLAAVLVGNALIAIVLAMSARDCGAPAAAPGILADAGVSDVRGAPGASPGSSSDPAVERACAALVAGWSEPAAAIVVRVGAVACGTAADAVAERMAEQWAPPPDAGVPDAGPPDAAVKRPSKKK